MDKTGMADIGDVQRAGIMGHFPSTTYIYSESKKTLPYALSQIAAGGIARTGVASAISVLSFLLPLLFFIVSQSNIVETMATSGMKD